MKGAEPDGVTEPRHFLERTFSTDKRALTIFRVCDWCNHGGIIRLTRRIVLWRSNCVY